MKSLMELINDLVEQESTDAVMLYQHGVLEPWSGSDEAQAARRAVEARIQAIRDAVYSVHGVDETVPAILDGEKL